MVPRKIIPTLAVFRPTSNVSGVKSVPLVPAVLNGEIINYKLWCSTFSEESVEKRNLNFDKMLINLKTIRPLSLVSKMYTILLLIFLVPCDSLLQKTKYGVSNLTNTLILQSSPFMTMSSHFAVEYGSPAFIIDSDVKDDATERDNDNESEASEIYEVRVLAPNFEDRNGKSLGYLDER